MKKVTIRTFARMHARDEKVVMVTAYDATMARILDDAGVDAILVGDSLGMVVQGHDSTLPVTLEQVAYHSAAVSRGTRRAHVVADLPFMTYQASVDEAVKNAGRLIVDGRAEAVKLEGGSEYHSVISKIVRAGIPVMGHLGLTPQSVHKLGGYTVQGKTDDQVEELMADAKAIEDAGAYALVLECVPADVADCITKALSIPTIGIGAGAGCGGQVLVCYDFLGLKPDFAPRFLKRYVDGYTTLKSAAEAYVSEVRSRAFPTSEHSFHRAVEGAGDENSDGERVSTTAAPAGRSGESH